MTEQPIYLGDGVYFVADEFQFRLFTSDGKNETNTIFLDFHVAVQLSEKLKTWVISQAEN